MLDFLNDLPASIRSSMRKIFGDAAPAADGLPGPAHASQAAAAAGAGNDRRPAPPAVMELMEARRLLTAVTISTVSGHDLAYQGGAAAAEFLVAMDQTVAEDITVSWHIATNASITSADFDALSGYVTIHAGDANAELDISALENVSYATVSRSFSVILDAITPSIASSYSFGSQTIASAVDDQKPHLEVDGANQTITRPASGAVTTDAKTVTAIDAHSNNVDFNADNATTSITLNGMAVTTHIFAYKIGETTPKVANKVFVEVQSDCPPGDYVIHYSVPGFGEVTYTVTVRAA